ncbi:hypothetical protein PUNSTDRAFT_34349, partial [Punctularia strigosozonata HHB-11173 SS5]|uniref:uncharacterized protein n=1 Tax=Punctularia strigosozonata (strain HHB-11173) TaxID=741275 RepID=UPI0004416F6A
LTLVLDKYLHWPIHARASSSGGVTCEDIFNAIYETFQVPLTEAEIAEIKRDRAVHDRVDHAFRRRCKRSVRLTEYEKSKGYRRVDVLGDRTWFFGM